MLISPFKIDFVRSIQIFAIAKNKKKKIPRNRHFDSEPRVCEFLKTNKITSCGCFVPLANCLHKKKETRHAFAVRYKFETSRYGHEKTFNCQTSVAQFHLFFVFLPRFLDSDSNISFREDDSLAEDRNRRRWMEDRDVNWWRSLTYLAPDQYPVLQDDNEVSGERNRARWARNGTSKAKWSF